MTRIIIGIIIIVIGLSALTGLSLTKYAIAIILIVLGISIIARGGAWSGRNFDQASSTSEDFINEVVIFGPLRKSVTSENFKGGKIVAVFGGGEVDLSRAKTKEKNVNMEFVAVFGGGKLIIPKDWRVRSQGVGIFGGYSTKAAQGEGETTFNIKGAAIFGGVEIVN